MTNDIDDARARRNGETVYEMMLDFMVDDDHEVDAPSFVLGVEFWQVCSNVRNGWRGTRPVHRANRARLLAAIAGFPDINRVEIIDVENQDTWADLVIS